MKANLSLRNGLAIAWLHCYRLIKKLAGPPAVGAFRILVFHHVPPPQLSAFERLIQYVLDVHGVLTPREAEARLHGKDSSITDDRIPCLLTFDDGYVSNVTVARTVLDRYGIHALFFICPGLMDIPQERQREAITRHIFEGELDAGRIPDDTELMSWADVQSLVQAGHTIGSHALFHRRLSRLADEDRRGEIIDSGSFLEDRLEIPVRWFAYPFGDLRSIDSYSLRIIGVRYEFCCSTLRGVNAVTTRPLELLRDHIDLSESFAYQRMSLAGGLDFRYRRSVKQLASLIDGVSCPTF